MIIIVSQNYRKIIVFLSSSINIVQIYSIRKLSKALRNFIVSRNGIEIKSTTADGQVVEALTLVAFNGRSEKNCFLLVDLFRHTNTDIIKSSK